MLLHLFDKLVQIGLRVGYSLDDGSLSHFRPLDVNLVLGKLILVQIHSSGLIRVDKRTFCLDFF